jgi:hypothetical protein
MSLPGLEPGPPQWEASRYLNRELNASAIRNLSTVRYGENRKLLFKLSHIINFTHVASLEVVRMFNLIGTIGQGN